MGSKVIVAIRHKNLEVTEKLDFACILNGMTKKDAAPKQFSLRLNQYSADDIVRFSLADNIVVSSAQTEDEVLYINNEMLFHAAFLSGARFGEVESPCMEEHIATFRFNARPYKLSIVKNRKAEPVDTYIGDKYSVFAMAIDDFPDLARNPHLMPDLAHFCRYKEMRLRTFSVAGNGVKPLGTYKASQALLVKIGKEKTLMEVWPAHQLAFTPDEVQQMWPVTEMSRAIAYDCQPALIREVAKGNGYTTIIKIKAGKSN